ncbi:hypothetical protein niasHT_027758 [Heterodera trifolii]|uniref:Uncharacterized protein n=1 Tax=Heterodera trifolii TaxID=157864 RepID=A0ABD2KIU8_9BILA
MAKFVGTALLALTIASMAFAKVQKAVPESTSKGRATGDVDGITEKIAQINVVSKPKDAEQKKVEANPAVLTNEPAAANEWNDQLMGMSVEKFNEELAVLLPKANTFMENALKFINEQMTNNGIATGAAGGSCSAGITAN